MIATIDTKHWHAAYYARSGSFEYPNEYDEEEDLCETEEEAIQVLVEEFGRDNEYYRWECDKRACLDDWMTEWWEQRLSFSVWRRND